MPLAIACTSEEKVPVTAVPVTKTGRPARLDGPLTVTVQSGTGTVVQSPTNPLSFDVVSGDEPGDTVYVVKGDADLGAGVVELSDTVTLTVGGANASNIGLTAAAAVPKA